MSNINNIIYESLGEHFKKHRKKYLTGVTLAALTGAGVGAGILGHKHLSNVLNSEKQKTEKVRQYWNKGQNLVNSASRGYSVHKTLHPIASMISPKLSYGVGSAAALHHAYSHYNDPESYGQKLMNKGIDKIVGKSNLFNAKKVEARRRLLTHLGNIAYAGAKQPLAKAKGYIGKNVLKYGIKIGKDKLKDAAIQNIKFFPKFNIRDNNV